MSTSARGPLSPEAMPGAHAHASTPSSQYAQAHAQQRQQQQHHQQQHHQHQHQSQQQYLQQHSQQQQQQQHNQQQQAASAQLLGEARETMDILYEVASLLNTGLDRESLSLCVSLIENGVNPEALAAVVKELKREAGRT